MFYALILVSVILICISIFSLAKIITTKKLEAMSYDVIKKNIEIETNDLQVVQNKFGNIGIYTKHGFLLYSYKCKYNNFLETISNILEKKVKISKEDYSEIFKLYYMINSIDKRFKLKNLKILANNTGCRYFKINDNNILLGSNFLKSEIDTRKYFEKIYNNFELYKAVLGEIGENYCLPLDSNFIQIEHNGEIYYKFEDNTHTIKKQLVFTKDYVRCNCIVK